MPHLKPSFSGSQALSMRSSSFKHSKHSCTGSQRFDQNLVQQQNEAALLACFLVPHPTFRLACQPIGAVASGKETERTQDKGSDSVPRSIDKRRQGNHDCQATLASASHVLNMPAVCSTVSHERPPTWASKSASMRRCCDRCRRAMLSSGRNRRPRPSSMPAYAFMPSKQPMP